MVLPDMLARREAVCLAARPPAAATVLLAVFTPATSCPPALLAAPLDAGKPINIALHAAADTAALDALLTHLSPRLLLVDMRWLRQLSPGEVDVVRRRHGTTAWMVAWRPGELKCPESVIRCHAVGGIDWGVDRRVFERATACALRGEYWFPRAFMQQLYLTLLQGSDNQDLLAIDTSTSLSLRQSQALALLREGLTNKQIAGRLGVGVNTVKKHLAAAFVRAGLHRRRQLIT